MMILRPACPRAALLVLSLVVASCVAPEPQQASPEAEEGQAEELDVRTVQVGLERLGEGEAQILESKRIGLVVHAASVTVEGRHAIDVLQSLDLDVVRLFSPEHGLRGRAAAGEQVESGLDPVSGLPVVSLYGADRQPTPEDLEGLDVLVFDLQGAGVRFYTYVSTMMLCLEAAGAASLEFVVLDRPNPLGGERIEGPVSAPREVVPASFVNMAPGPLVHGLTLGEMARFVNAGLDQPAQLTVIPMQGWNRGMVWDDTGRPWVSPSPNLRSAEAALAYPGTAFLEVTNVNEGRGTTDPFLIIGAPWLDPSQIQLEVPAVSLETVTFVPEASPAAQKPKYLGEECAGFRVVVTDAAAVEPYRLGVSLITQLMLQPDFAWRREGEALTWLMGTPRLYADFQAGKTVDEFLAADLADHEAWRQDRQEILLY
jgi:uncharacterized protein YbbC (DUF1343 family)